MTNTALRKMQGLTGPNASKSLLPPDGVKPNPAAPNGNIDDPNGDPLLKKPKVKTLPFSRNAQSAAGTTSNLASQMLTGN